MHPSEAPYHSVIQPGNMTDTTKSSGIIEMEYLSGTLMEREKPSKKKKAQRFCRLIPLVTSNSKQELACLVKATASI